MLVYISKKLLSNRLSVERQLPNWFRFLGNLNYVTTSVVCHCVIAWIQALVLVNKQSLPTVPYGHHHRQDLDVLCLDNVHR